MKFASGCFCLSIRPSSAGTGLGLSIAAKIVQEHGGSLRAEANSPKGARFLLRLPLMETVGDAQPAAAALEERAVQAMRSAGKADAPLKGRHG